MSKIVRALLSMGLGFAVGAFPLAASGEALRVSATRR